MRIRPPALSAAALAAAVTVTAAVTITASATADPPPTVHPDAPLVAAFEQVDQSTTWTISKTVPQTWLPAGADWEQEGFKFYGGRYYISVFDKTNSEGHLVVLGKDGKLIKDIPFVDGLRQHAGGIDVHGHYAYVPLAVDTPHSSADILRVDIRTFAVTTLFTVDYDHVGGVTFDPLTKHLIGQDWDSRTFYEWTLDGTIVTRWRNPSDYVGYQDCQYVPDEKLLCSASPLGVQRVGGFDLIDLASPEHALLNGVPQVSGRAGNANEILATPAARGTRLVDFDASHGPIVEYTTIVPTAG